jgi:predicted membrane protein
MGGIRLQLAALAASITLCLKAFETWEQKEFLRRLAVFKIWHGLLIPAIGGCAHEVRGISLSAPRDIRDG